jgi:hypothetical protein
MFTALPFVSRVTLKITAPCVFAFGGYGAKFAVFSCGAVYAGPFLVIGCDCAGGGRGMLSAPRKPGSYKIFTVRLDATGFPSSVAGEYVQDCSDAIASPDTEGMSRNTTTLATWPVSSKLIDNVTMPASVLLGGYGMAPVVKTLGGTKCAAFFAASVVPGTNARIASRNHPTKLPGIFFMAKFVSPWILAIALVRFHSSLTRRNSAPASYAKVPNNSNLSCVFDWNPASTRNKIHN